MLNYFLTTIKFEKTAEEGKVVKVSEQYLVDALSFTEAEAIIIKEMKPFISGEFMVMAIKRERINELFPDVNGDKWYKCKVAFITLDETTAKEKRNEVTILVQADSLKQARENLENGMNGTLADWDSVAISETKIMDVFMYKPIAEE